MLARMYGFGRLLMQASGMKVATDGTRNAKASVSTDFKFVVLMLAAVFSCFRYGMSLAEMKHEWWVTCKPVVKAGYITGLVELLVFQVLVMVAATVLLYGGWQGDVRLFGKSVVLVFLTIAGLSMGQMSSGAGWVQAMHRYAISSSCDGKVYDEEHVVLHGERTLQLASNIQCTMLLAMVFDFLLLWPIYYSTRNYVPPINTDKAPGKKDALGDYSTATQSLLHTIAVDSSSDSEDIGKH